MSAGRIENETSWLRLANGDLYAAARTYGSSNVVARRSTDGGRTRTREGDLTMPGQHPADLTLLPDGNVLLTYGVRNQGQWAVHLRTWGDPGARCGRTVSRCSWPGACLGSAICFCSFRSARPIRESRSAP